jgi:hypothetical protein
MPFFLSKNPKSVPKAIYFPAFSDFRIKSGLIKIIAVFQLLILQNYFTITVPFMLE